jgi:hypothetical protein
MKFIYLIAALVSLAGCASNPGTTTTTTAMHHNTNNNVALSAFENICLKTAPSFTGALQAASHYGITNTADFGYATSGFNKDQSLGIQIKANKECVITTPARQNNTLTRQFIQLVSRYSNISLPNRVPLKVDFDSMPFIFHHDREGGEAFVMVRAKS